MRANWYRWYRLVLIPVVSPIPVCGIHTVRWDTRAGGVKLHPALRVETDCRLAFARLLRELDLDLDPPADVKRAPALRSIG